MLGLPKPAAAGPLGGTVVEGAAGIVQSGPVTNVNQSSTNAVINWQGFSIGPGETVNFNQPSATAATLNRVVGFEQSVIAGALNANGRVFIVNAAGVVFTKGAQVNVGGLVASTLDISNKDFMAGNYTFSGTSQAAVINRGRITARSGGFVSLLGKTVANDGVISARLGTVAMASGEKITLNFGGNSLLDITIDKGTLNGLVANNRAIRANGGTVILTAKAADQLLSAQVNNSGVIQARTIAALKGGGTAVAKTGTIRILAHGGKATIGGKLDASAPKGGDGGFIETSGDKVSIANDAVITTKSASGKSGTWLIDPTDFTIAPSGGDMTGAQLANQLSNNAFVIIEAATMGSTGTSGSIYVNDAVTWASNAVLTLNAIGDITINKPVTATGDSAGLTLNAGRDININNAVTLEGANATLAMNYGGDYNIRTPASYAGAETGPDGWPVARQDTSGGIYGSINFTNAANLTGLTINGQAYTLVHSMTQLDMLDGQDSVTGTGTASIITDKYALAQNLNADGTTYTRAVIGTFGGTLIGLGHTIDKLKIDAPTMSFMGLIGQTSSTSTVVVRDLGLVGADVSGRGGVGSLLGRGQGVVTASNVYATGVVTATGLNTVGGNPASGVGAIAGGLIGQLQRGGAVSHAFANVNVSGFSSTGGLIGSIAGNSSAPSATVINNVHATGNVTTIGAGVNERGGLIGVATLRGGVSISNAYATGDVAGTGSNYGGLIGSFGSSLASFSLSNSFAIGRVGQAGSGSGDRHGGLVGLVTSGTLDNVYHSAGDVMGNIAVGGLIGEISAGSVNRAFASGNVSGVEHVGGFVGRNAGTSQIRDSFATATVQATSGPAGGFAGSNFGTLSNVYGTGAVTAAGNNVGGLVGINQGTGVIRDSYATGNVNGGTNIGGFAGQNLGTITGSHSHGSVTGKTNVGGFIGLNTIDADQGQIFNHEVSGNYSTGHVTGETSVGGFAGRFEGGVFRNNFWNTDTSGQSAGTGLRVENNQGDSSGLSGLTNEQFRDIQHYLDGTIAQVLADRAAQAERERAEQERHEREEAERKAAALAAAQQAAARRSAVEQATRNASSTASNVASTAASTISTAISAPRQNIDGNITIQQPPAAQAAPLTTGSIDRRRRARKGPGSGIDIYIRSIEVEGHRFDLQKQGGEGAPPSEPAAPSGDQSVPPNQP